jgi:hypothetical protein
MKKRTERIEYLKERLTASESETKVPTYTINNWRDKPLYLPIIRVDNDYLMYRMENSRTEIQQLKYIHSNPNLPNDFFTNPESEDVQFAQENILNDINNRSGKEFLEDLKRIQKRPIIVTVDGYIVNGNRRIAAFRAINKRYVDCTVLPEDATVKDIYELEQELQIAKDFKLDYHWINELKNIKKGMSDTRFQYSESEMAERLRISLNDVKLKIKMFDYVEAFLQWKGITGQFDYDKIDEAEQAFIELAKNHKKFEKSPKKLTEFRNAVFSMIEEKPTKGRLYNYITYLAKNFDSIYNYLTKDTDKKKVEKKAIKNGEDDKQSRGNELDEILDGLDDDGIQDIFSDKNDAEDNSDKIQSAIGAIKNINKEKDDAELVFNSVSTALASLQGLEINNDCAKLDAIIKKLDEIERVTKELKKQVQNVNKNN